MPQASAGPSPRLGAWVFLGALGLFVAAMAPGLYLRDSGELTTAAFSLGVAHETGFPLWCLLGKAVALLPLGEVATRVDLFSALAGAVAAWLVYRTVRALAVEPGDGDGAVAEVAGVAAAALLVADYTVWKQSTVAEVYAPTLALMALALELARRAFVDGDRRAGPLLWLVAGLALGAHASFRLLLLPPLALLTLVRLRRGDRWPLLAPLAFAVGAAVVFYLPLRAARAPAADWADPRTLGGLLDHLAAARIRRAFSDQILARDPARLARHLARFAALVEEQVGIPALLAAALGLGWLAARRRPLGLLVGCVLAGDVLYAAWINPMGIDDLQCGTPTALALAIAGGVGLAAAARALGRRAEGGKSARLDRAAAIARAAALATIALVPAALGGGGARFGLAQEAPAWVRAALAPAPSRALVLSESDDLAAGAMYAQSVWGLRPDVTALVRQELWDATYLAQAIARGGGSALPANEVARWAERTEPERMRDDRQLLGRLVAYNLRGRAVLWEPGDDHPPATAPGSLLAADVPLYRLVQGPVSSYGPRPLVMRIDALLGTPRDPLARRLEARALTDLGATYAPADLAPHWASVDSWQAPLFETALRLCPDDPVAAVDLAVVLARRGELRRALSLVEGVLARDPDRLTARINAGRLRLLLGDLDGAEREFRRARRSAPTAASPLVGLARVAHSRGDDHAARSLVDAALAAAPSDAEAIVFARELGLR